MVRLDYLYVTNWSLMGDLRLIALTIPALFRRTAATRDSRDDDFAASQGSEASDT
jgi:lipopolysaccharide/colanic/teichoic acid biosynthesis glycosyltransferase